MADARTDILRRIGSALSDRPAPGPIPRDYDRERAVEDPIALFAERVADYRAAVRRVKPRRLGVWIDALLDARDATTIAAPADIPKNWRVAGIDWRYDDPPLSNDVLDSVDGVLTGCAVAIAETGTVILDAGVAQGRRVLTLLPDYHLCVVRHDQIVATVPEALARLADPTRPLTFISGSSATSDIEFDRVEGVHGPRTLEVLIVDPPGK